MANELRRIYYVGVRLAAESVEQLRMRYGRQARGHITIAYSRKWFPYKSRWIVFPHEVRTDGYLKFGDLTVLAAWSDYLIARHVELRQAGATWDYEGYTPHVTLGVGVVQTPPPPTLIVTGEYYMTWEEDPARRNAPEARVRAITLEECVRNAQ